MNRGSHSCTTSLRGRRPQYPLVREGNQMAVEKSYTQLGFFIVVGVVVILATALLFIQRMRTRAVIALVTYTTENVSGLDVSSPVRYRGVPVGLSLIHISEPTRLLSISYAVFCLKKKK